MEPPKNLPKTWGSKNIEDLIYKEISQWRDKKISIAEIIGFDENLGFIDHINSITIPELFAAYCTIVSERNDIRDTSASLQAFQTYRVSLFDILDDNHLEVFDQPTILKLYGEHYVRELDEFYKKAINILANELVEKGIRNALDLIEQQYEEVLVTDRTRNANYESFPIPLEAIKSHEKNAGGTARFAVYLSGGNFDLEVLVSSLANAMACCDDLVDMVSGRDLEDPKLTIPLSYLTEEVGDIREIDVHHLQELVIRGAAFEKTKIYINSQLDKSKYIMRRYPLFRETLIPKFLKEIDTFLDGFRKNYLL